MNDNKQDLKKNKSKKLYTVMMVFFILLFLVSAAWLIRYFIQLNTARQQIEALQNAAIEQTTPAPEEAGQDDKGQEKEASPEPTTAPTQAPTPEPTPNPLADYDVPEKDIDFATLQEETNVHIYAWITVPGTVIDYPVLQHPEVIGYYLEHNLDHSTGYPGCVYSQLYNSKEWDDPITVLYGHNMKDGSMFAGLHQYEDSAFFAENPYIYIYTEDGKVLVYEIFAAYEYTDMDLVRMYQLGGEEMYTEYLSNIYSLDGMNNNFNTEIEVTIEDKVLTLATCISTKPNNRYLVQGKLVAEGTR